MLTKSEIETLRLLSKGQEILKKFKVELASPACYKRFRQNIRLLMGAHNMTLTVLSEKVGHDTGGMSKLISNKSKFERVPLELSDKIASALRVNTHSLLFVDLQKNFLEMVKQLESASS